MSDLKNIKNLNEHDLEEVGIKAALLGRLSKGFNVAPGYVLTKTAIDNFLEQNQFKSKIRNLMAIADPDDEARLQDVANELQKLILSGELSPGLKDAIVESYFSLNIKDDVALQELVDNENEPLVVVRSSSIEPAPHKANLSLLHVKGKEKLLKSIITVIASLFTAESLKNRLKKGIKDAWMPVIIQKMIIPNLSGLIYSQGDELIVKACYGLSDETTQFDKYILSEDLEIKTILIEKQKTAFMQDPETEKLAKIELSEIKADNQKLNEKQAKTLARLFKRTDLKDKMIEFIIDQENYYFVQVLEMIKTNESEKIPVQQEEESKDDETVIVDLDESKDAVQEPVQESAADESKKENTLFSIFKSNRGEDLPEISTTPEPENNTAQVREEIDVEEDETSVQEPEQNIEEEPDLVESEAGQEFDKRLYEDEKTGGMSMDEEEEFVPNFENKDKEELLHQEEETIKEIKPLNREEWLETLKMEHTKILLSYDIVILSALKKRYKEYFDENPTSFENLIDRLKTKISVPYEEDIKKIKEHRNRYLEHQKPVSMEELKNAYEKTVLFLREF